MDARVLDTDSLVNLAFLGARLRLNRQLDVQALKNADPDGVHVLHVVLPYHNGLDAKGGPHHRCEVLIKENGTNWPASAFIDVPVEYFDRLTKASDYLAAV